jgi:hypothetical protein
VLPQPTTILRINRSEALLQEVAPTIKHFTSKSRNGKLMSCAGQYGLKYLQSGMCRTVSFRVCTVSLAYSGMLPAYQWSGTIKPHHRFDPERGEAMTKMHVTSGGVYSCPRFSRWDQAEFAAGHAIYTSGFACSSFHVETPHSSSRCNLVVSVYSWSVRDAVHLLPPSLQAGFCINIDSFKNIFIIFTAAVLKLTVESMSPDHRSYWWDSTR